MPAKMPSAIQSRGRGVCVDLIRSIGVAECGRAAEQEEEEASGGKHAGAVRVERLDGAVKQERRADEESVNGEGGDPAGDEAATDVPTDRQREERENIRAEHEPEAVGQADALHLREIGGVGVEPAVLGEDVPDGVERGEDDCRAEREDNHPALHGVAPRDLVGVDGLEALELVVEVDVGIAHERVDPGEVGDTVTAHERTVEADEREQRDDEQDDERGTRGCEQLQTRTPNYGRRLWYSGGGVASTSIVAARGLA